MIDRKKRIKEKGFRFLSYQESEEQNMDDALTNGNLTNFNSIRVGVKKLSDATYTYGTLKQINSDFADKKSVLEAIYSKNYSKMRDISNFFFESSGIYSRLCRYMAYLYRYDWLVTPYIYNEKTNTNAVLKNFDKVLSYLDSFEVKKFFGETALKVLINGCYYGYMILNDDIMNIQELPPKYCRSRFNINNHPAIEFNMKFFDDYFKDTTQKMKMLKLFPKEFAKGYLLYKEGKLVPDFKGDTEGWYLLDPKYAFKFNMNGRDYPSLISVIPAIIDLDEAQELDKKKMEQRLLKIIIQKMPVDKNGDLVFDIDEATQLHNNAVRMLGRAIGVDVLTTFADVDVADMDNTTAASAVDELEKVERNVYNEAGVSQMQFNTDGNIALEKSIQNDEAAMYNLLIQFEAFLNDLLIPFNKTPKKIQLRAQILTTTIYNYKEMAKLYKEQTQLGYSKMLPQIALGQSQSSILANAYFENDILDLVNVFIPPLMSSTMNGDTIQNLTNRNKTSDGEGSQGGRPEKADDEKSTKTIQNKESQN